MRQKNFWVEVDHGKCPFCMLVDAGGGGGGHFFVDFICLLILKK